MKTITQLVLNLAFGISLIYLFYLFGAPIGAGTATYFVIVTGALVIKRLWKE
jgi:hypothetical protein